MMEYFDTLLRANEWDKALKYGDQLLTDRSVSEVEVVRIYCGLCEARHYVHDYSGSVEAGKIAMEQAIHLKAFDQYGTACLALSATYLVLSDLNEAKHVLVEFLNHLHAYSPATRAHEAIVWFNLGKAYMTTGNGTEAARAYSNAVHAAEGTQSTFFVHSVRQSLIEAYLNTGNLEFIPRQLARCAAYLRHVTGGDEHERDGLVRSGLVHIRLRVEYAMASGRLRRAKSAAIAGLAESEGLARHQFTFHMLMARIAQKTGSEVEAVGHALSARVYAMECQRLDLETEAAEFTYEIATKSPGVLESVEKHYFGQTLAGGP